jgi:signal transduction histidine kinase
MASGPITSWLKRCEARADAWAAKRLTKEEYQDAVVLDAELKRNFWRWLLRYGLVAALVALAIELLMPKIGWVRASVIANILCAGILGVIVSAWYGYRKWSGPSALKTFTVFILMMVAGGVVGAIVASFDTGKPITELSAEKASRIFGVVVALGGVLVAMIASIAYLRRRDVQRTMALLQAEAERERYVRQGAQAELKLLQAQVEPHFLFNTLANLRFLVQTGSPQALDMLDHLIHYLRTALPEIRAESSTIGREVELARAYLEILRIRMGGALEIHAEVQPGLEGAAFPPLVVLTLVENAIKHGIAPRGSGSVWIRASSGDGKLRVVVEDDGRGLAEPIGRGVGLGNVRERLRALYGSAARFDLSGREGGGTAAMVEMPL